MMPGPARAGAGRQSARGRRCASMQPVSRAALFVEERLTAQRKRAEEAEANLARFQEQTKLLR